MHLRRLLLAVVGLATLAAGQPVPDLARRAFNAGVALQKEGNLEGARRAYEQALETRPDYLEALANLGAVLLQSGKDAEAAGRLGRVLELRPGLDSVRTLLGLALFRSGQTERALAEAEAVLSRQPGSAQALHLLGLCLLRQERFGEGIEALVRVLQLAPQNLSAAATLATAYAGSGRIEEAEAVLEGPLGSSGLAEAFLVRGVIDKARGNWVPAVKALEEAVRLNPNLPTVHSELGHAYLLTGDGERAEREFRIELATRPADFHSSLYLGWLYLQQRKHEEALAILEAARLQKPTHPQILHMTGQAEFALGRWEKAREALERSVQNKPDLLPAHVLLARVFAKLRRAQDLRRRQTIIAELTRRQQERNLLSQDSYGGEAAAAGIR